MYKLTEGFILYHKPEQGKASNTCHSRRADYDSYDSARAYSSLGGNGFRTLSVTYGAGIFHYALCLSFGLLGYCSLSPDVLGGSSFCLAHVTGCIAIIVIGVSICRAVCCITACSLTGLRLRTGSIRIIVTEGYAVCRSAVGSFTGLPYFFRI